MPHQCTKCGKVYPDATEALLKGCECTSRFFYYIRQELLEPNVSLDEEMFESLPDEIQDKLTQLDRADKTQIEKDIRDITGLDEKSEKPVILDLKSVKVLSPGKFEIDVVKLFNHKRPLIYK
jgi:predicted  nucleic acid-binding Zn-ribbon protein